MTTLTYETMMSEIKNLVAKIENLHIEEDAVNLIQNMREKVKAYGLTAADLGLVEKLIHTRRKPEVKFRDNETGASWTGRGKLPNWIKESGKEKEEFLVGDSSIAANISTPDKVVHHRRKPEVKFHDKETGSSWTGRGKLPNWIKESGKMKEEFLVC